MAFQPDAILRVLNDHGISFVVIGGVAATLHGAATVTFDLDIVPDPELTNLDRLSAALDELEAKVRVDGIEGGLDFDHDATSLGRMGVINLVTNCGDLDIALHPSGAVSFEQWREHSEEIEALGVSFLLAALEDVIASKEAAAKPKDAASLPALRELLRRRA